MCFAWLFRRFKKKKNEEVKEEVVKEPQEVQPPVAVEPQKVEVKPQQVKPAPAPSAPAPSTPAPQKPAEVKKVKEIVRRDNGKVLVKVRYNRSFTAKLIQGDDKLKRYYSEIKNELMRYGVKSRISWRYETFKKGRKLIARLAIRGKTLGLYLALNPREYEDSEYKIDDVSKIAKNVEVPLLYKIKNDRRCRYSKELIADAMEESGLEYGTKPVPVEDYAANYPYERIEALLERGLVKLLKWQDGGESAEEGLIEISNEKYESLTEEPLPEAEVEAPVAEAAVEISVAEADERISDEEVESFVQESERYSDRTKRDIVNIDTLGKYFKAGESVTVEEIVKRVPSVHRRQPT